MKRWMQILGIAALLAGAVTLTAPARAGGDFPGFSQAQLDQMLAPVALYPDTVLSHVLIAATYPLEVVQAARWSRNHPELRGELAVDAVVGRDWDPSVMALVAFPDLLARMDADLDWTQMLGDAFLVQEEQVLDSIQRLRAQAHQSGHLGSNEHVQVVREREVIYIEPARRQVIYLPYYDPWVVYGSWRWSSYPPVYWRHPPRHRASVAFYWGPAYHVAPTFFFSSFHWSRRQLVVVHHHHHYYRPHHYRRPAATVVHQHFYSGRDLARHNSARRWTHEPTHRRGVAYRHGTSERHRQAGSVSRSSTTGSRPTAAREASPRAQQREWAQSRRDSGLPATRSVAGANRSASSARQSELGNRLSASRSQSSTPARVTERSPAASRSQAATRASRSNAPRSARSSESAPNRSSRAAERPEISRRESSRQISARSDSSLQRARPSAPDRQGTTTSSRPAATRNSAPAPRASAPRSAPARQAGTRASAPRSSTPQRSDSRPSSAPQTRSTSPARSAPTRPARTESRGVRSTESRSTRSSVRSSHRRVD